MNSLPLTLTLVWAALWFATKTSALSVHVEYEGFGPKLLPAQTIAEATGRSVEAIESGLKAGRWGAHTRSGPVLLDWDEPSGGVRMVVPEGAAYGKFAVVRLQEAVGSEIGFPERPAGDVAGTLVPFCHRLVVETNAVLVPSNPPTREGDAVFWRVLIAGHGFLDRLICPHWFVPTQVDGGELVLEVATASQVGGRCRASMNGSDLGDAEWTGRGLHALRWRIPHGVIRSGSNRVEWAVQGVRGTSVYADRAELWLEGSDWPGGTLEVEALADGTMRIPVDGSIPTVVELGEAGVVRQMAPVHEVGGEGKGHIRWGVKRGERFWVVGSGGWQLPRRAWLGRGDQLYQGPAGSIRVVVPEGWTNCMPALEEAMAAEGYRARVHLLGEIQDGAGCGDGDPIALTRWLGRLAGMGKRPENVLLIGDGHMDVQQKLGEPGNYMPPKLESGPDGFKVDDTGLGDVDGDGWPEIIVSRIPVRDESECLSWLAKRSRWRLETRALGPGRRVLIASDAADPAGNFALDGQELALGHSRDWQVQSATFSDVGAGGIRESILAGLGGAADFVHYLGHGGRDRLGTGYLTAADLSFLPAIGRPSVLVGMTCGIGQFAIPQSDGLGEGLVRLQEGGAMAVWASTGTALSPTWRSLSRGWTKGLSRPDVYNLSDLVRFSIQHHREMGGEPSAVRNLVLLGDGLLPVSVEPKHPGLRLWVEDLGTRLLVGWTGGQPPFTLESFAELDNGIHEVVYQGWGRSIELNKRPGESRLFRVTGRAGL